MTEASRDASLPGVFITFEGTEGSGKTTQLRLLQARLEKLGYRVTPNQEPGGTAIGKDIRRILLDPANSEMASETELLLMFASRTQAAAEVIRPALSRGDIVLSDRWTDSSLAYQGAARELGFQTVLSLHRLALGDLQPDLTVCVSIDIETGLLRANSRNRKIAAGNQEARIDRQSLNFHLKVGEAYRTIAQSEPNRFRMVDGSGERTAVFERVWAEVSPLFHRKRTNWTEMVEG
ncbi:MAG: dTMP kinase [Bryobacteraceae bacterium]